MQAYRLELEENRERKGERGRHTLVIELFWEKAPSWTRTENSHSRVLDKEIGGQVRTRPGNSAMLTCLGQLYSWHSSTQLNMCAEARNCGKYLSTVNFSSTVDNKLSDAQRTQAGCKGVPPVEGFFICSQWCDPQAWTFQNDLHFTYSWSLTPWPPAVPQTTNKCFLFLSIESSLS